MSLASEIIDQCYDYLHDDASIWSRAELLRWLDDGYSDIISQSNAVVRPFQHDLPGRTSFAITFEWEDRHAMGLLRRFSLQVANGHIGAIYRWETEFLAGIEPTDSDNAVTQLWEMTYTGTVDEHFRFALPRSNEKPLRVYWDDKSLAGISNRELDLNKTKWWQRTGQPLLWLQGSGREQSFEVFEVTTAYVQSYDLRDFYQGVPRLFTSDADREYEVGNGLDSWNYSYSVSSDSGASHGLGFRFTRQADTNLSVFCVHIWEKEFVDGATIFTDSETLGIGTSPDENPYPILGVGLVRGLLSNDRQYLACAYDCGEQITGVARYFGSSRDAITLWHTIQPTRDLIETDSLDLIPKQLHKYLRYYALHMAFARPGQGYRPDLADHFDKLYSLGVLILKTLGTPTFLDRNYAREQINDVAIKAVGRVRFPSTFERTAY